MRQPGPRRRREKRPSRSQRHERRQPARALKQAERRIEISLPAREREPERVVAHLGPTNSGKTYAALEELVQAGAGVYAGPLRVLAPEAHRPLGAKGGVANVGPINGGEG